MGGYSTAAGQDISLSDQAPPPGKLPPLLTELPTNPQLGRCTLSSALELFGLSADLAGWAIVDLFGRAEVPQRVRGKRESERDDSRCPKRGFVLSWFG